MVQTGDAIGGKRTRQSCLKSFQVQVIDNLVVLEEVGGETSMAGTAGASTGEGVVEPQGVVAAKGSLQMVVYNPPNSSDGKLASTDTVGITSWPWAAAFSPGTPSPSTSQHQGPAGQPLACQMVGWPWGG